MPIGNTFQASGYQHPQQEPSPAYAPSTSADAPSAGAFNGMRFSKFICTVMYFLLDRLPSTAVWGTSQCPDFVDEEEAQWWREYQNGVSIIHRILKTTSRGIPLPVVLVALKLIQRIAVNGLHVPAPGLEPYLFATALMIAQKVATDHCYSNRTWAKIIRMPTKAVSKMEFEFLGCLQYHLHVSSDEYATWFLFVQTLARKYDGIQEQGSASASTTTTSSYQSSKRAPLTHSQHTNARPSSCVGTEALAGRKRRFSVCAGSEIQVNTAATKARRMSATSTQIASSLPCRRPRALSLTTPRRPCFLPALPTAVPAM
ncbi:hypothetical protein HK102_000601 [Quaeritorhiza haematococci]|nr:hypothetical protein HK102_000601 [Quaeritorhiza haematococci]